MKRVMLLLAITVAVWSGAIGQEKPEARKLAPIYNPDADIQAVIRDATVQASKENKHILLMFGGNWCIWCHRLHALMNSNSELKTALDKSYIMILVDIGESADKPLNRDLLKKYKAEGFGYPVFAVLDAKGELLAVQSTGVLEKGKGHDPARVLHFLNTEAPGTAE